MRPNKDPLDTEVSAADSEAAKNRLFKFLLAILVAGLYALYYEVASIQSNTKTIIQFPQGSESAEIGYDDANDRYLMMVSEFFAATFFGVSPATVEQEFSLVLSFSHPTTYQTLKAKLESIRDDLILMKTLSSYGDVDWSRKQSKQLLRDHEYIVKNNVYVMKVAVSRSLFIGTNDLGERKDHKTLAIEYTIENGRFYILDLRVEKLRV